MLLTIGGSALLVLWRNDRGAMQVFVAMLGGYGLVAGLGIGLHAAVTPAFVTQDIIYITIFAAVLVIAVVLTVSETRSKKNLS